MPAHGLLNLLLEACPKVVQVSHGKEGAGKTGPSTVSAVGAKLGGRVVENTAHATPLEHFCSRVVGGQRKQRLEPKRRHEGKVHPTRWRSPFPRAAASVPMARHRLKSEEAGALNP